MVLRRPGRRAQEQLKLAQQFLGVEVQELPLKLVKQELRPLPEVIENYDELCEYFTGTEWEYLFHDPSDATQPKIARQSHGKQASPAGKTQKFFRARRLPAVRLTASLLVVGLFLSQLFASKTDAKEQTVSVIGQVAARSLAMSTSIANCRKRWKHCPPAAIDHTPWTPGIDRSIIRSSAATLLP